MPVLMRARARQRARICSINPLGKGPCAPLAGPTLHHRRECSSEIDIRRLDVRSAPHAGLNWSALSSETTWSATCVRKTPSARQGDGAHPSPMGSWACEA